MPALARCAAFPGVLRSKTPKDQKGAPARRPQFPEFCEAKLRKVKLRGSLTRARDRSGIFAEQKLERIARFFAGRTEGAPQKMRPN
jgi:hypothetical protein